MHVRQQYRLQIGCITHQGKPLLHWLIPQFSKCPLLVHTTNMGNKTGSSSISHFPMKWWSNATCYWSKYYLSQKVKLPEQSPDCKLLYGNQIVTVLLHETASWQSERYQKHRIYNLFAKYGHNMNPSPLYLHPNNLYNPNQVTFVPC